MSMRAKGIHTIKQRLFAVPILPGKAEQARAFLRTLEGERKAEFAACEARLGVTKEVWAIQSMPQGDMYLCYFAAADVGQVAAAFTASDDEFDLWFNGQLAETAGPNWGSQYPSEIVANFDA
jgi:hypothetical protein